MIRGLKILALILALAPLTACAGISQWGNSNIMISELRTDGKLDSCKVEVNAGTEQIKSSFSLNKIEECKVRITFSAAEVRAIASHEAAAEVFKEGIKDSTGSVDHAVDTAGKIIPGIINPAGAALGAAGAAVSPK